MKKNHMAKDEYIGFRTSQEIKQILQKLADEEYRTLSQQCEMAIIEWLVERGYFEKKDKVTEKYKKK
ncbi:MAG TPA: hypothetical protein PLQ15_00810 [Syntrophales bacterium]|nr:hypothetical protein [Syntrophales bacterium]